MVSFTRRNSIKVYLRGGLGNQLYQYAAGVYLAEFSKKRLVLDTSLLPVEPDKVGDASRWPFALEELGCAGSVVGGSQPPGKANTIARLLQIQRLLGDLVPNGMSRLGYWASERRDFIPNRTHFSKISHLNTYANFLEFPRQVRHHLRDRFKALETKVPKDSKIASLFEADRYVAVHLRLGDYVNLEGTYGRLTESYFREALSERGAEKIILFTQIASEVPNHLLDAIGPDVVVDEQQLPSPVETLLAISNARHIVCSNSTFSWWAAFLADDETKVYAPRFTNRLNIFRDSMNLPHWRTIDVA